MASKTEIKIDRFGTRVKTQAAAINAAMTAKPQTTAQLAAKLKLPRARVSNHMSWLMARKHIIKTEQGYRTKPARKKK